MASSKMATVGWSESVSDVPVRKNIWLHVLTYGLIKNNTRVFGTTQNTLLSTKMFHFSQFDKNIRDIIDGQQLEIYMKKSKMHPTTISVDTHPTLV